MPFTVQSNLDVLSECMGIDEFVCTEPRRANGGVVRDRGWYDVSHTAAKQRLIERPYCVNWRTLIAGNQAASHTIVSGYNVAANNSENKQWY